MSHFYVYDNLELKNEHKHTLYSLNSYSRT